MTSPPRASRHQSGPARRPIREKTDYSFLMLKFSGEVGVPSLRKFRSFSSFLAIFVLLSLALTSAAHAQTQNQWTANGWVASGSIYDLTGNANLSTGDALVAGHSYNLTLQIDVPNTSTQPSQFQVSLNNAFGESKSGPSVYWVVHTAAYPGYNRSSFEGGSKTVSLNYIQGTVKLSAYFEVPVDFTIPVAHYSTPSGNGSVTLHLPQEGVKLASVVPVGQSSIGYFSASVEDQSIQTFQTDYNQTSSLIPSGKISTSYSSLVNGILAQAQALNKLGLPTNGSALLNLVVPSAFPAPPSSALQTYLLLGLVGAIVVIVVLAMVAVRSRGKSGYSTGIINDVQKDLAVLEVTAAKYDKSMADKLKSLRDRLSESR